MVFARRFHRHHRGLRRRNRPAWRGIERGRRIRGHGRRRRQHLRSEKLCRRIAEA